MIPSLGAADLARLCPRADPRWAAALLAGWPDLVREGELTTPTRARHFLAQCAEESGGLRVFEENLNYSAERLRQVWPGRFRTRAAALMIAHDPKKLANAVYGGRSDLGNSEPGDGWRFHGRGPIQATGRAWAKRLTAELGIDLVAEPDRLLEPATGWRSAAAIWRLHGCNAFADRGDFAGETRRLNGGLTNIAERRRYLAIAAALPMSPVAAPTRPATPPEPKDLPMTDLATALKPAIARAVQASLPSTGAATRSAGAIATEALAAVAADPAFQHAANAEPWYRSRVALGAVVSAAAPLLGLVGLTLSPENRDAIVNVAIAFGGIAGPALTLYGRFAAKVPLGTAVRS